jgi:hopanoid biosynthesis associated RND transporter like protein HpnN
MKEPVTHKLFARLLGRLAGLVCQRRHWFIWPQLILFGLCVVYTVCFLEFDTSRSALVGADKRYHHNFLQFKKEFAAQDDLAVVIESENPEKNRQFVERLGAKIEAARIRLPVSAGAKETVETNLFARIFYKGDLKMLGAKALLFVPEDKLVELKNRLTEYRPLIEPFTQTTNLVSLMDHINTRFQKAERQADVQTEALVKALPALERIITQATSSLRRGGIPPSPGVFALFDASREAEQSVYITFAEGQIYLVTAQALTKDLDKKAVARMRQLLEETRVEVPGVNAGLTGESVLELDELEQSQKDTATASVVALFLSALIFIYGYHETGRPLKATACLVVGIGYTMGFATLVIGHLNILTITFVPILIGLAIDFGVHLVTRYEEELRQGKTEAEAITKALVFTGQGIFTGALTTAGAFLAMGFTDFRGIQEMGIICGGGLLVCLIPMLTMLPALLLRGRQNVLDQTPLPESNRRERIENFWLQRPIWVIAITIGLSGLGATQLPKINFDYNLLHLQSAGLPAVQYQDKLLNAATSPTSSTDTNATGRSVLFAAVITDSVEHAVALEQRLLALKSVAKVDSVAPFLAENPKRKLQLIGEIKQEVAPLRFRDPDPKPVQLADLSRSLFSLGGFASLAADEVETTNPEIAKQLRSLHRATELFRLEMWRGKPGDQEIVATKLGNYQRALFEDLQATFEAIKQQDNREGLRVRDLPPSLRERFVGATGKFLLQVYPKENVWQRGPQEEFVRELRTIDPDVTGTPVQLLEYISLLKLSYEQAAYYSLAAIALLVFVHFRRVGSVLLALVPVFIGALWLGGVMGWFAIPLNPANIMLLPLVLGIGVTNGVHILNRFAEERNPSILAKSTGKAVLVSGLTTIAGFGSLLLAKHQGIKSLGLVMAIGVATCMVAGLTFLPALLNVLMRKQSPKKNQPSDDNARSSLGREEPR